MTKEEAADLLDVARRSMRWVESGMAEDYARRLRRHSFTAEHAHQIANYVLPRGRLGRITLVLNPPDSARAIAFIAAVLRAVE